MRRAYLAVWCLAAVAALSGPLRAQQAAPPPDSPAPRIVTANAVVRGRVVESNGAPVRGAEVRLRSLTGQDSRLGITDVTGQYEVHDLVSGQWVVKASKAGFVSQGPGRANGTDGEAAITIANGQRLSVDIVLTRGSAIAGRVVDEAGDPLADVDVRAMKMRGSAEHTQYVPLGVADRTDDTGAFRLYGLPQGTYYLRAQTITGNRAPGLINDGGIYYPGTSDPAAAETVTVTAGQDQLGLTLVFPPAFAGVSVSGAIFDASGAPAADDTALHLTSAGGNGRPSTFSAPARVSNGQFVFNNVPAGDYVLDAMGSLARPETWQRALVPLSVGTSAVSNVVVTLTPTRTLKGTLLADAGTTPPRTFPTLGIVIHTPDAAMSANVVSFPRVGDFSVPGIWGVHGVTVSGLPLGWMVKSIDIAGHEIGSGTFDFAAVPASATLRIIVTDRVGELSGTVRSGNEARRAVVVVFPEDETKWRTPTRYVVMSPSDDQGRFRVSSLGEMRYLAVAVSSLEPDELADPGFLSQMKKTAKAFDLREGEKKTLDLPLVER